MTNTIIEQDLKKIVRKLGKDATLLSGKTLFISGGAGFIGSYLLRTVAYLNKNKLSQRCRVISVDNYLTGVRKVNDGEFPANEFLFIEHDIRKSIDIPERVDFIIHAAGVASPIYYQKYPLETIESAIWGAKNLLELARVKKVKSFLYFSSSEIYGDPDPAAVPTPETYRGNVSSIGDRASYDESKRLGETLCMTYYKLYKTPVKIVRPFNVFGPGMKPNDFRVIPTFLYRAFTGKYLPVHDKGNQTRTFCYISDAVTGFLQVLLSEKSGEVYNVGNDTNEINMMSLAETVVGLLKKKPEIRMIKYPDQYPSDEPRRRCPDLTKIKTGLGYTAEIDLKYGLRRTLKWYKANYKT